MKIIRCNDQCNSTFIERKAWTGKKNLFEPYLIIGIDDDRNEREI